MLSSRNLHICSLISFSLLLLVLVLRLRRRHHKASLDGAGDVNEDVLALDPGPIGEQEAVSSLMMSLASFLFKK